MRKLRSYILLVRVLPSSPHNFLLSFQQYAERERPHRQDGAEQVPGPPPGGQRPGSLHLDRRHRRGPEVQDQDPGL